MSALRPECRRSSKSALSYGNTLKLLLSAVSRRRSLAHGALDVGDKHCAMGCFWEDNPGVAVYTDLVDKVAAINDLTPRATPKSRWKRVMKWLRNQAEQYA